MIFDEATISVRAGDGGDGSASFRREKFVPLGGPDGGDGGRGGSIYLVADPGLNTLLHFSHRRRFKAESGGKGQKSQRHGAAGSELEVKVPIGTVVFSSEGEPIADLREAGDRLMVARGGKGGLGNMHFTTSTNQAPRIAQKGEPGEEREVNLELRLIADVGLLGYPNVGKSTFLAAVTRARPKIADYPFTTLTPNLGVASVAEDQSMVIADIPGLIEGAHAGVGLGHEFLRHILRTLVLIHIVDGTSADPVADFHAVNEELRQFDPGLLDKAQVVAVNKMDLPDARDRWPEVRRRFDALGHPVYAISAATGEGVTTVLQKTAELLARAREEEAARPRLAEARVVLRPRPADEFEVVHEGGVFRVIGQRVERIVVMTDLDSPESVDYLQRTLSRLGVTAALAAAGAKTGDTVRFGSVELEWMSG
jgi:GTP-binding protein